MFLVCFKQQIWLQNYARTLDEMEYYRKFIYILGIVTITSNSHGVDFKKKILPMLEKKCMSCHREPYKTDFGRTKKPKGNLILNTPEGIKKGDKGKAIVANNPNASSIYKRVKLEKNHDRFMPPLGKEDPLTKQELKDLENWIKKGADTGDWKGTNFKNTIIKSVKP